MLSQQRVAGTQPKARKTRRLLDEDRDTTDPKMVTDFLMSCLLPLGRPASTSPIWKNTRDEVFYASSLQPWRRSPLWLVIRVVLQLGFSRVPSRAGASDNNTGSNTQLYKEFMAFNMAQILSDTRQYSYHSDLVFAMGAKIRRRMEKVKNMNESVQGLVHEALRASIAILQQRWDHIQQLDCPKLPLSSASGVNANKDTLLSLPRLDEFIHSISARGIGQASSTFEPRFSLKKYPSHDLPVLDASPIDELAYQLMAFETWVATSFSGWRSVHRLDASACGSLRRLIENYHRLAAPQYSSNPESLSLMILVALELWVGCDELAVASCPLLKDYDPGIPREMFQGLLLPFKEQMARLHEVEKYLIRRTTLSTHGSHDVFETFGGRDSFPCKWFQQSPEQQELKRRIEQWAAERREAKRREFRDKKNQYESLMRQYETGQCQMMTIWSEWNQIFTEKHSYSCNRCAYLKKAEAINISIHEWPLPSDPLQAQATVFELRVPGAFGHWRDATKFLLSSVLGLAYSRHGAPRSRYTPSSYRALQESFEPFGSDQRIVALSEKKPHEETHRRRNYTGRIVEDDVCLPNGLLYHYYDEKAYSFVQSHSRKDVLVDKCMYKLPIESSALQQFLRRESDTTGNPSPNSVLASQSESPEHLSLEEYKALCSIPIGFNIQWQNILVQLHALTVDLKRVETTLTLLQCAHQAGPNNGQGVIREAHEVVSDAHFASRLLDGLEQMLRKIQGNWQASQALFTLISLACRLHTLGLPGGDEERCLHFLSSARATAMHWLGTITEKAQASTIVEERLGFGERAVSVALISSASFFLDQPTLRKLLSSSKDASVFLRCSIVIQEGKRFINDSGGELVSLLYHRWRRISYRSYQDLARRIVDEGDQSLDNTILKSWPAYQARGLWKRVSSVHENWLVNDATNPGAAELLTVHFNLLNGELLVNGVPLGRLPAEYERHDMYRTLFGRTTMEVMPTAIPGMRFSGKSTYAGYTLHFGMSSESDLLVRAVRGDQSYELVPSRHLEGHFPAAFIEQGRVHWYDAENESVLFHGPCTPWEFRAQDWVLTRTDSAGLWRLRSNGQCLVDISCKTARDMAQVFDSLAKPPDIHCTVNEVTGSLNISLPRLCLGFHIAQGNDRIESRQYRGMFVDKDQNLGSLAGFGNKLILRGEGPKNYRTVIIPYGTASHHRFGEHVAVKINKSCATKAYSYRIDDRLGRLVDDGSLLSKLWICYLHALTSFCLPDPLTGKTGTEQALSILDSAAVKSFGLLSQEQLALLGKVSRLTPRRTYYPAHERVMQVTEWLPGLGFFAQHGRFHPAVQGLLDRHTQSQLFSQDLDVEMPDMGGVDDHLLARDDIRSSTFHVAEYGAERFTTQHDAVYPARDKWRASDASARVAAIARTVYHGHQHTAHSMPSDLAEHMWQYLNRHGEIHNDDRPFTTSELAYNANWLSGSNLFVCQNWIRLHAALSAEDMHIDKFSLMVWLSTLAYGDKADMPMLHVLASFRNVPSLAQITAPEAAFFLLSRGYSVSRTQLRDPVLTTAFSFRGSPDAKSPRRVRESNRDFDQRRQKSFSGNRNAALDQLVNAIMSQWPCQRLDRSLMNNKSAQWSTYFDTSRAMAAAESVLKPRYENRLFRSYLHDIADHVSLRQVASHSEPPSLALSKWSDNRSRRFVDVDDLFSRPAPKMQRQDPPDMTWLLDEKADDTSGSCRIERLIARLESRATSAYEKQYVEELRASLQSFLARKKEPRLGTPIWAVQDLLRYQLKDSQARVRCIYGAILDAIGFSEARLQTGATHWPRVSPALLLRQLTHRRWHKLPEDWKNVLACYGMALSFLQQTERRLSCSDSELALVKELGNTGHTNWDVCEHPESLLLEIESNITIREVQERVAQSMRIVSGDMNQLEQLNMGEGKSSVIVPIIAAALANCQRLVRVIVAKPQAKQMLEMLVSKLGGLLDRPIFHMPFSRAVKAGSSEMRGVQKLFQSCMEEGGVLLVQPEHILSFKLMGIERKIMGKDDVGSMILDSLTFLDANARDIVDESDENFSVKFELIYTIGMQRPIDHSPDRWICIHELLVIFQRVVISLSSRLSHSVQISPGSQGAFPRTRILQKDAEVQIMDEVARTVCQNGFAGFPISRHPTSTLNAVYRYITVSDLAEAEVKEVEEGGFWSDSTAHTLTLLLLRGLIAEGVLAFAFSQKRWRVDYGFVHDRVPPTRLAVPYRAMDSPSPRSEFSHPDVVILLTSLSCYYGGLSDDELFQAFHHLFKSDQADTEYQAWVREVDMPQRFRQLDGINLDDVYQCLHEVFPHLRFCKAVIDYFLSYIVFPKEMKEFPHKLSASGWDIGELRNYPTTGFSGTKDAKVILPSSVVQLDLPDQAHTNALVLNHLLRPENDLVLMRQKEQATSTSDAERLLSTVMSLEPSVRVIIDVGAQVLELSNLEMAQTWLELSSDDERNKAVVFFDEHDHICVLDRRGTVEPLHTSPYSSEMDACLVFLDEVHTRGTDLKLPRDYRAAVTLGANLTKDRLVQGRQVVYPKKDIASANPAHSMHENARAREGPVRGFLRPVRHTAEDASSWPIRLHRGRHPRMDDMRDMARRESEHPGLGNAGKASSKERSPLGRIQQRWRA